MNRILIFVFALISISSQAQLRCIYNDGSASADSKDDIVIWYRPMPYEVTYLCIEWDSTDMLGKRKLLPHIAAVAGYKIIDGHWIPEMLSRSDYSYGWYAFEDQPCYEISIQRDLVVVKDHKYTLYDFITGIHNTLIVLDYLYGNYWK